MSDSRQSGNESDSDGFRMLIKRYNIIEDAVVINIDLRNSTLFKDKSPSPGAWEPLVAQLEIIKQWLNNKLNSPIFINFTGDGYMVAYKDFKILLAGFENHNSDISFLQLIEKLLKIRKSQIPDRLIRQFKGEDKKTLLAPRISIHYTTDKLLGINGADFIGPDLDFVGRLNNPKVKDSRMAKGLFLCPWDKDLFVHSPIFLSSAIAKYMENFSELGVMDAKGVENMDQTVFLHHDSGTY